MRSTWNLHGAIRRLKANHWLYLVLHLVLLLVGLLLVMSGRTLLVAIGGSVIATAVAGSVLFLRVWLSEDDLRRMQVLTRFGLTQAFERRSIAIRQEYDSRLSRARKAIDIMGFGLRALKEDYHREFPKWAQRSEVRILLLDPEYPSPQSSIADQRDKEEKADCGQIRQDVRAFVRECAELLKDGEARFRVRLYRCLPSINLFRIDGDLFWGPYLVGDVSRNFPTFLVSQGGVLYRRFVDHFEAIWSDSAFSRAVPEEWLVPDEATGDNESVS